ncbi:hypothetical protein [Corynebacterium caspium]|uniref:hypothetical protein n=1 Tax=Corynebacterium caspium TaxID=234828 RepID=UPI0003829870|nr:hypothetical protein [Corynebacterium caspium]WKD59496.1 hypothetical protein CCASP_05545 [Corynebacterium caspium DSM 44850]
MSFYEDIAAGLDAVDIESRAGGGVLFVPITPELEIQFVEIDPVIPAASVYIAAADIEDDDDDFNAALVAVVFSAEEAVDAVSRHIATDRVVTLLKDLIDGYDERIGDLDFSQDEEDTNIVRAEVGGHSAIVVTAEVEDNEPLAYISFISMPDEEGEGEVLDLGVFRDFDKLFDVISLAADCADSWEEQLLPIDDGADFPLSES